MEFKGFRLCSCVGFYFLLGCPLLFREANVVTDTETDCQGAAGVGCSVGEGEDLSLNTASSQGKWGGCLLLAAFAPSSFHSSLLQGWH